MGCPGPRINRSISGDILLVFTGMATPRVQDVRTRRDKGSGPLGSIGQLCTQQCPRYLLVETTKPSFVNLKSQISNTLVEGNENLLPPGFAPWLSTYVPQMSPKSSTDKLSSTYISPSQINRSPPPFNAS